MSKRINNDLFWAEGGWMCSKCGHFLVADCKCEKHDIYKKLEVTTSEDDNIYMCKIDKDGDIVTLDIEGDITNASLVMMDMVVWETYEPVSLVHVPVVINLTQIGDHSCFLKIRTTERYPPIVMGKYTLIRNEQVRKEYLHNKPYWWLEPPCIFTVKALNLYSSGDIWQWQGTTVDDKPVYIRARGSTLSVRIDDTMVFLQRYETNSISCLEDVLELTKDVITLTP